MPSDQRSVLVLAGGLTHEREVSLRSGSRVAESLRRAGHDVVIRDADVSLIPWLTEHRPDVAVIMLHGGRGENGAVQGILEMAGVPFLGTAAHDCRFAWDKPTAKNLLRRAGLPHAGLVHPLAQHVPRPRGQCLDRSVGRQPRHPDHAEAAPGRFCPRRQLGP